jgi:hypothetical protein
MRAAAAMLVAGLLAGGCGGSEERAASTATPTPTPTPTPTVTPTASPTAFAPSAPAPPENGPEAQPGGAGDEEPIRQRVRLTIDDGGVTPRVVKVSAFLPVELVLRNATSGEQIVFVRAAKPSRAVSLATGETGRLRVDGLRRGRYVIDAGQAGRATLVSSLDEP